MKKRFFLIILFIILIETLCYTKQKNKNNDKGSFSDCLVQVVMIDSSTLNQAEALWLPEQIIDKLKSNLQDYLNMQISVDTESEKAILELQRQSENNSHDENDIIEFAKLKNAKFQLLTKIRKTNNGYVITADFKDATTGISNAIVTSKEYSKSEYLYNNTGAIDEVTILLADKLNIKLSEISRITLTTGSAGMTLEQLSILAKQNEAIYKKQQNIIDAEIKKLSENTDLETDQNIKKLEAQKLILKEKLKYEEKHQKELSIQKNKIDEDKRLETERSISLKNQRDEMSKSAAKKAAEVRKLKVEKQGILGQINLIESKKRILNEIRYNIEQRCLELHEDLIDDRISEANRIRNKNLGASEKDSNGKQTEESKKRRETLILKSYEDLTNAFLRNCENVKNSVLQQENLLLEEIQNDQKTITNFRTASSLGNELEVRFSNFDGSKNGWNAYLTLYSDSTLLYSGSILIDYETATGKKVPSKNELLDINIAEQYDSNIDIYNSLLLRCEPILYFELDYNVYAETEDKPSQYKFNFDKIRIYNTISGKLSKTISLNDSMTKTMSEKIDIRKKNGICESEKENYSKLIKLAKKTNNVETAELLLEFNKYGFEDMALWISKESSFMMQKTEVTQELYSSIMGKNPSGDFKQRDFPVCGVSWYDAIYFCNKLSQLLDLEPVYQIGNVNDISKWNYSPHREEKINNQIIANEKANGFRLPTYEEWSSAARINLYPYAGGDKISEVAWYKANSRKKLHPVGEKRSTCDLYDMTGNVSEWVYSKRQNEIQVCGGSYCTEAQFCRTDYKFYVNPSKRYANIGFRLARANNSKFK